MREPLRDPVDPLLERRLLLGARRAPTAASSASRRRPRTRCRTGTRGRPRPRTGRPRSRSARRRREGSGSRASPRRAPVRGRGATGPRGRGSPAGAALARAGRSIVPALRRGLAASILERGEGGDVVDAHRFELEALGSVQIRDQRDDGRRRGDAAAQTCHQWQKSHADDRIRVGGGGELVSRAGELLVSMLELRAHVCRIRGEVVEGVRRDLAAAQHDVHPRGRTPWMRAISSS